jgi:hypothetical protein
LLSVFGPDDDEDDGRNGREGVSVYD